MELKKGYKNTEIGVIPEDWKVDEIGNRCTIFGRIGFRGYTKNDIVNEDEGAITISPSNISDNKFSFNKATYISWFKYHESPEIKIYNGDILLVKTGSTFGKTALVRNLTKKATINPQLVVLKNIKINNAFLGYLMCFKTVQNQIKSTIVGGAIPTLSQKEVASFKVPIPPLPEQTAIAAVLSDTDSLIQALEKKIDKKLLIKKGAMQKLLTPKEGWEVKSLGEICDVRKGQLITSSTKIDGNIPVIAGGKTPAYYHKYANRNGKTITISASGANAGYIAFHNYPIFASDCSTISESKEYTIEYIYFILLGMQDLIYKMQTGGAQPHIHPRDIKPITIPFPPISKQIQTAQILSDMDSEIEALQKKLDKYNQLKLGMMQNLLTGKIRLV